MGNDPRNPKQKISWRQAIIGSIVFLIFAVGIYFTSENKGTPPANTTPLAEQNHESQTNKSIENDQKTKTSAPSNQQTFNLIDIDMISETTGWKFATSKRTVDILKTIDGGEHWKVMKTITGGYPGMTSAFFLNPQTGWIGYTPNKGSHQIHLLFTQDGGKTWGQTNFKDKGRIIQIHFLDSKNGWVLISPGLAAGSERIEWFHTHDGGQNWTSTAIGMPQQSDSTIPFGGDKTGFRFINETTGWLTGFDASGKPYLFATHDGGKTWERDSLPVPQSMESAWMTTFPPVFFTKKDAVLPVRISSDKHNISMLYYTTHNAGESWEVSGQIEQKPGSRRLVYDFLDLNHWYAADGNHFYFSADQGKHWIREKLGAPAVEATTDLEFVSPQTGWLVYNQTSLYKTTDRGETWERQ
ncbi:MAG TPA: hypothetical protein VFT51_01815 [Bacillales bacterium]|nr:hypothetical protein [Bacillales bacterium]